jgi:hypothetical protein
MSMIFLGLNFSLFFITITGVPLHFLVTSLHSRTLLTQGGNELA